MLISENNYSEFVNDCAVEKPVFLRFEVYLICGISYLNITVFDNSHCTILPANVFRWSTGHALLQPLDGDQRTVVFKLVVVSPALAAVKLAGTSLKVR
jgi:hypothetical protein